MLLKKLIIIFFSFLAGNAFGLGNSEINDVIKKYLKQNDISQSFSINKKLKLPNCKKNIEVEKRFETYKTLDLICPQDNPWIYNVRIKIQNIKNNSSQKKRIKKILLKLCEKYNSSEDQILLAWLLFHPSKIYPVVGTTSLKRLKRAFEAIKIKLEISDWFLLLEASMGEPIP